MSADLYECPYCGETKPSENGTGSDVACCGERGQAIKVRGMKFRDEDDAYDYFRQRDLDEVGQ